jgi:hypothetical protein
LEENEKKMREELNNAEERLRHKENDLAALQKRNQVPSQSSQLCVFFWLSGSKYN